MLLLRPLPDELLGSVFIRNARLLGIPIHRIPGQTSNRRAINSHYFPSGIKQVAADMGMHELDLLRKHTLMPYMTASLSEQQALAYEMEVLRNDSLQARTNWMSGKLSKPNLRVCSQCLCEDRAHFGCSYWHRTHLLPGVHVCHIHGVPLSEVSVADRPWLHVLMPDEAKTEIYDFSTASSVYALLSKGTFSILDGVRSICNAPYLKSLAKQRGYQLEQQQVFAPNLTNDLLRFFGTALLREMKCSSYVPRNPWPVRVLRDTLHQTPTMKYLLIWAFLSSS